MDHRRHRPFEGFEGALVEDARRRTTGVLLAGGGCRRTGGRDKAFLPIPPLDPPLRGGPRRGTTAEATLELFGRLFGRVLVAGGDASAFQRLRTTYPHEFLPDEAPRRGPLAGMASALTHARTPWSFVVACDMPYLQDRLIETLLPLTLAFDAQAIVPSWGGRLQPLHAFYHTSALHAVRQTLDGDRPALGELLRRLTLLVVSQPVLETIPRAGYSFRNLNHLDDWLLGDARRGGDSDKGLHHDPSS